MKTSPWLHCSRLTVVPVNMRSISAIAQRIYKYTMRLFDMINSTFNVPSGRIQWRGRGIGRGCAIIWRTEIMKWNLPEVCHGICSVRVWPSLCLGYWTPQRSPHWTVYTGGGHHQTGPASGTPQAGTQWWRSLCTVHNPVILEKPGINNCKGN